MNEARNGSVKPTVSQVLGEMVWILSQARFHKHYALADLEWLVMPAILAQQFRIFRTGETPVGFALWAYLSDDAQGRVREQAETGAGARLRPGDWKSGDNLWLVDLVTLDGSDRDKITDVMIEDLRKTVFLGKRFKFHLADPATVRRHEMELGE